LRALSSAVVLSLKKKKLLFSHFTRSTLAIIITPPLLGLANCEQNRLLGNFGIIVQVI
jgi:hypothetical protein